MLDSEHVLGKISHKTRAGNEFRTRIHDAANPTKVTFPQDLGVKMKAVILGGGLLFTIMAFQMNQNLDSRAKFAEPNSLIF